MPHDKNAAVVEVGQIVRVDFKVTAVQQGDDYCNASLETVEPMHPGDYKTTLTINTKQCKVVRPATGGRRGTSSGTPPLSP